MKYKIGKLLILGLCLNMLSSSEVLACSLDTSLTAADSNAVSALAKVANSDAPEMCVVTVITKYLDEAYPSKTVSYMVEHGDRFEQLFEMEDGYEIVGLQLYSAPLFNADVETKTVSIDAVQMDYTITLEFDKIPQQPHNVTVISRYLDDALPEKTETYQVADGASFIQSFEVLEGYDLYNFNLMRSQPVFDVDMEAKTVSIDAVNKDYDIVLEFDKTEYPVNLTLSYADGSQADQSQTYWIKHGEGFHQVIEIPTGYEINNLDQLPDGVSSDPDNKTITIESVTAGYDIMLVLEKGTHQVTIKITYEDGAYDDQEYTDNVVSGSAYETDLLIERGYAIKNVSLNAAGVVVNRTNKKVRIECVTEPVTIVIKVR